MLYACNNFLNYSKTDSTEGHEGPTQFIVIHSFSFSYVSLCANCYNIRNMYSKKASTQFNVNP